MNKEIFDIQKYNPQTIKLDILKLVKFIKKNFPTQTRKSIYLKKYFSYKGDIFLDIEIVKEIKLYNITLVTDKTTYDLTEDFFVNFLVKKNVNLALNLLYNSKRILNTLDERRIENNEV